MLWIGAMYAYNEGKDPDEQVGLRVGVEQRSDAAAAMTRFSSLCEQIYPKAEGWKNHQASFEMIEIETLLRFDQTVLREFYARHAEEAWEPMDDPPVEIETPDAVVH